MGLDRSLTGLLIVTKGLLIAWGVLGFVEYAIPSTGFGLQDANFPPGVQFLHWLLISTTGCLFIGGYVARWAPTRHATITLYAMLATLCFVETVDFNAFGGGTRRFYIMAVEYVLYVVLSFYLLRSEHLRNRFTVDRS